MNKWLFLAFLSFYLLTASFRIDSGDGSAMFQVTDSMLNGRGFVISDRVPDQDLLGPHGERVPREEVGNGLGLYGVDGRYYAKFGPVSRLQQFLFTWSASWSMRFGLRGAKRSGCGPARDCSTRWSLR